MTLSRTVALTPALWSECAGSTHRYECVPRVVGRTDALAVLELVNVRVVTVDHVSRSTAGARSLLPLWFGPTAVDSVAVLPSRKDVRLAVTVTDGATVTVATGPQLPPSSLTRRTGPGNGSSPSG